MGALEIFKRKFTLARNVRARIRFIYFTFGNLLDRTISNCGVSVRVNWTQHANKTFMREIQEFTIRTR